MREALSSCGIERLDGRNGFADPLRFEDAQASASVGVGQGQV
jgi:hypothetical protein